MAKISNNPIPDINADWGLDTKNGYPYSGKAVQDFIKEQLRKSISGIGGKFGHVSYEGGRIQFYSEAGGSILGSVTITGTSYSINVETNVSSNFTVLSSDTTYPITLTPTTKSMELGSSEEEDYPEDYTFKLEVDNGSGYSDRTPSNNTIQQGSTTSIDIRKFLVTGENRIRIIVTGVSSEQPKTLGFTATLTTLSLSCEHPWNNVWYEGSDFSIEKIYFTGNVAKTLYVKVGSNDPYTQSYTASTQYPNIPTSFNLKDAEPKSTGIVPIEIWLEGGNVETKHIYFNIMYVKSADIGKTSLICVNNIKSVAYNFTEELLFQYSVYNIYNLTSKITYKYGDQIINQAPSTQVIVPETVNEFTIKLQINTQLTEDINVEVELLDPESNAQYNVIIPIDNSLAYLPTEGYDFYLNPSLQDNAFDNKDKVVNSAILSNDSNYSHVYDANWDNFTFADDAWNKDEEGNKALVVKAGSTITIPELKPFKLSNTDSATIEFMFKANNIADYNTPIFTCIDTETYDPTTSIGLVVFPTKILLLSGSTRKALYQQLPLSENRIHHITVVIHRLYGSSARNLARIFINGCENVTFEFSGNDGFYNSSSKLNCVNIGQNSTDTYLYMLRIYKIALDPSKVFSNYLNALIGSIEYREGLRDDNNIIDGTEIDYELCKKRGFNRFIVEIPNDGKLPSLSNKVEYTEGVNIHLEYNDTPKWNVSIYNVPLGNQGTTSSLYEWHNLRSKIKNKVKWVYPNIKDTNGKVLEETSKTGYIAGYLLNPAVQKITWKKNVASQPQGHKMGATSFYNDIFKRVMGGEDKLVEDQILPTEDSRVAVYQYPFMGFQKFSNGSYKFIGLYTGGPDKTDKKTFGYDQVDNYPNLMMIEGPNHDPYLTRFLVPWTDDVFYDYNNETLSVGAPSPVDGYKQEGWDADIAADYSTDEQEDAQNILNLFISEFKPAYDAIYYNSPYIAKLNEVSFTIKESNTLISGKDVTVDIINKYYTDFINSTTRGYKNNLMTFYNDNYELIYFRVKTQKYEVLPKTVHNMLEYLGLNGTPSTDDILNSRRNQWIEKVGEFVNLREAYYRQDFDELIGASDNDAKNSYWRKFQKINIVDGKNIGGKWGYNEDDLDTIFQNDNNGQDTKEYYVEPNDTNVDGNEIFQGRTSAFWFALRMNCTDQLKGMMKEIIDACIVEAESKKLNAEYIHKTVFNLFSYYFWDHSSKYFPATAYNADTQLAYIDVWFKDPDRLYNNVPPLTQIHGDHYETERSWVEKRIAYIFSKYQLGAFEAGAADGYGSLEITPAETFIMNVTPAIWLYPRISAGGAETYASERVKEGESYSLQLLSSGTTGMYIKGLDWLSDLGDLSNLVIATRGGSTIVSFSINAKRLRRLKIGDESNIEGVKFNANTLGIKGPSLEIIDARNVKSAMGDLSLQECPRLREAYFGGTNLNSITFPIGGRLEIIQFPDTITSLILSELNLLSYNNVNIPNYSKIKTLYCKDCKNILPFELLKNVINAENSSLEQIGIIWTGTIIGDNNDLQTLTKLIEKEGEELKYKGIDYTDNGAIPLAVPYVSGILDLSNIYVYKEDIDEITSTLTSLKIIYNPSKVYVKFKDPVFNQLIADTYGDGIGVTQEQLDAITSLPNNFGANSGITNLIDFDKIKNLTSIGTGAFSGCTIENLSLYSNASTLNINDILNNNVNITNVYVKKCDCTITKSNKFNNPSLVENIYYPNTYAFFQHTWQHALNVRGQALYTAARNIYIEGKKLGEDIKTLVVPKDYTYNTYVVALYQQGDRNIQLDEVVYLPEIENATNKPFIDLSYSYVKRFRIPDRFTAIDEYGGVEIPDIECFKELDLNNLQKISRHYFRSQRIEKLWIKSVKNWLDIVNTSNPFATPCSSKTTVYVGTMDDISTPITLDMINEELKGRTTINAGACQNMTQLEGKLIIPDNVTNIGNNAFKGCGGLTSVTIPGSVTSIGEHAFHNCTLENFTIEDTSKIINMTGIGDTIIKNLYVNDLKPLYKFAFRNNNSNNKATNIYVNGELVKNVFIDYTEGVNKVTLLFQGSTITSAKIAEGYTNAGSGPFEQCSKIRWIDFPSTIQSIGWIRYTVAGVNLIVRAVTPPSTSLFFGDYGSIYVPNESVEAYKTATGWSNFADKIRPLSEIEGLNLLPSSGTVLKVTTLKATYDAIEVTPEYTIEGTAAIIEDGVLIFSNVGEVTVTATYNGESVSRTYSCINADDVIDITSRMTNGYSIPTPNVGNVHPYTTTIEVTTNSIVLDATNIKYLRINGQGGKTALLWCFTDENDIVISRATEKLLMQYEILNIPSNAKKIVINLTTRFGYDTKKLEVTYK